MERKSEADEDEDEDGGLCIDGFERPDAWARFTGAWKFTRCQSFLLDRADPWTRATLLWPWRDSPLLLCALAHSELEGQLNWTSTA